MNFPDFDRRTRHGIRSTIVALLCVASRIATHAAEPPVVVLDPLSVIAHPSGADERTASIWVVTANSQPNEPLRTSDLFVGVPGVHIDQPGGPGGRATLYLRGAEENFALVFLDGVPLNDPTNSRGGAVDLSMLEPALLRTVATVRGPASVRYGPEALAGVVHFESAAAADAPKLRAALEGGGDSYRHGSLALNGANDENLSGQLSLAATRDGSLADGSRVERIAARASLAWARKPFEARLSAWHLDHEADNFPDDSGGFLLAAQRTLEHRDNNATGAAVQFASESGAARWNLHADVAQFDANVTSPGVLPGARDPFGVPASDDDTRLRRYRASASIGNSVHDWTLTGGIDAQREEGRDTGALHFGFFDLPTNFEADRDRVGAFAEASGKLASHVHVVAGARIDRFSDAGTHGTVRAGLLMPIDDATQWRINAGTAFKPPSFYAIANPLVGNPALLPERGRTLDAGVRRTFADQHGLLDLTLFTSEFRDGIDFDPGPPPRLINRTRIRSRGAEAALVTRVTTELSLGASLTLDDARSQPDGARLRGRPHTRAGFSATWTPQHKFTVSALLATVGRVPDTSVPTGDISLGSWARLDLSAVWKVHPSLDLTAALDNALGKKYEEAIGFPSPGRRVRIGLRTEF